MFLELLGKLMTADWLSEKAKKIFKRLKIKTTSEFTDIMEEYDGDDQRRIKKYFNEQIDVFQNELSMDMGSFISVIESVIEEGELYPEFSYDPSWTEHEVHMYFRLALRAKFLAEHHENHEFYGFCNVCGDFLDYQSLEGSCKHEYVYIYDK